jgi:hypothetical protein
MVRIYELFRRIVWSKLLQLNSDQSVLFHRYCQLISNRSENLDIFKQSEEIKSIWVKAIDDQHLSSCLELIDYFVGSESLDSNSDRSIYLEEYLQEEVEKLIIESGREDLLTQQQEIILNERNKCIQEYQKVEIQEEPIEMIFVMLAMRIKEIKETASELVTEAAIKVI